MEHGDIEEQIATRTANTLLAVVQGSCGVRSRDGLATWLHGDLQQFVPHELAIVAWGNFRLGSIAYESVVRPRAWGAPHPEDPGVRRMLTSAFSYWSANEQSPVAVPGEMLQLRGHALFPLTGAQVALAHGLNDCRGEYDCLYVFVGPSSLQEAKTAEHLRLLLPSIDAAFRQGMAQPRRPMASIVVKPAPRAYGLGSADEEHRPLSTREHEVMHWVRLGKTNSEIASIMNLSTFTVKNHMRRIYKKLDVLNRAQAVGQMGAMA